MATPNRYVSNATVGWVITALGCVLWTYGYFLGEANSLLDWPSFSPHWIADYLPNWQSEIGMALTLIASGPIYYAQIQELRSEK